MLNAHIPPCGASAQGQPDPKSIIHAPSAQHSFFGVIWFGARVVTKIIQKKKRQNCINRYDTCKLCTTLNSLIKKVYFDAKTVVVS